MTRGRQTKYEGVYLLEGTLQRGLFHLRAQVKDEATGGYKDSSRKPKEWMTLDEARDRQVLLKQALKNTAPVASGTRFGEYAATVIQRRIDTGAIQSPKTKTKYWTILRDHMGPWADVYVDKITRHDVQTWHQSLGRLVLDDKYAPNTVNDWWTFFRSVIADAAADFGLPNPATRLHHIPTHGYRTYTKEEPNALQADELPDFFWAAWKYQRQHYAMLALGMMTGRRACELRPLRAKGPRADIDWKTGALLIRRSQTIGKPMEMTKQKKDVVAYLPPALVAILERHVADLRGPRADSELLFPPFPSTRPRVSAEFLAETCLRRPVETICRYAGIKKHLTAKGAMRRTYHNLGRKADVNDVVLRSMSGHATQEMLLLYSEVAATEGRASLQRMIDISGVARMAA